jgi:protein-S-isoprenylcysteine O-methyltransferase Ste14
MLLDERLKYWGGILFKHRALGWLAPTPLLAVVLYAGRDRFGSHFAEAWAQGSYEAACLAIALLGETVRILTIGFIPKGTSGRNTLSPEKASTLNTLGMYSVVRNPLYLGNFITQIGVGMLFHVWELSVLSCVWLAGLYVPIILAEERFLLGKFGDEYVRYAAAVPCFLPQPRLWKRPELQWSWRMVIRREHDTIYAILLMFSAVEQVRSSFLAGRPQANLPWLMMGAAATALWLLAEFLKKCTSVLRSRPKADVPS